jgi:undecaprenyl-diphosphatase
MNIFHAVSLSVIEGVTEFLPISSTGHMILVSTLFRIQNSEFVKSFEIIIQLGAILAVFLLYWKKLLLDTKTFSRVGTALVPTAIVGLVLYKFIKQVLLASPWVVVWSLGIGGILLIIVELFHKETTDSVDLTPARAFLIGCAQSLSVIPGVSRAAATIVGAMLTGMKRKDAVEFSFLLAIPTMFAATGLDLVKSGKQFTASQYMLLGIGFIGAFISAIIVVRWLLHFVIKNSFIPFGIYRIFIAIIYTLVVLR